VTGASRGIGAETAKLLGSGGARVYVNYLKNRERAEEVAEAVHAGGGTAELVPFNASDHAEVAAAIASVLEREETIHLLVNNAGVRYDSLTHSTTTGQWEGCVRDNLNSVFYVTHEVVKAMVKHGGGSIVMVSSIAGSIGSFGQSAYAAAKAGIVAFAKSVALEYASRGVRANAVIPGIIRTDMTANLRDKFLESVLEQIPCKRLGEPAEVAPAICFLLSDAASYINGATLHINGGGLRL